MSDTLTDAAPATTTEEVQPAHEYSSGGDESADSAPASDGQHEQNQTPDDLLTLESQKKVNDRFNSMTAERYELRDSNTAKDAEIARLTQQIASAQPEPTAQPNAVKLPDSDLQFDNPEEYARQADAYNRSVAKSVYEEQTQAADLQRQQTQQAQRAKEDRAGYIAKTQQLGLSVEEADASIQTLMNRGISESLGSFISSHDKAPAIAAHLAKNPAVFEEINALSVTNPLGAAQKLALVETEAVTRNISSAPAPNTNLNGLSAREPSEFDKRCPGAVFKTN